MSKFFNSRAFISLSIFLSFSVLLVTSILMFIDRHTLLVAMLHTLIGMTLLLVAFWHMKNNLSSLLQYFKWRVRARNLEPKINMAMPLALLATMLIVALSMIKFSPFLALYEWGSALRAGDKAEEGIQFTYVRVDNTPVNAQGARLTIDLRKGAYFTWPQYAIWLETLDGEFIQPLYVTQKLAKNEFSNKVTKRDPSQIFTSNPFASDKADEFFTYDLEPQTNDQRMRPESLPVFLHKLGIQTTAGVFVPTGEDSTIDAYGGATMLDHFLLSSQTVKPLPDSYKVRFEINESFDFNAFYSSDRYPDDPIYSGNGYSAQPSLVYEAIVDTTLSQRYFPMAIVGRGHHSGRDGELYKDLENLTTALEMVDRIIVEIH
ncbi:MAG: DUF4405 domain-containing protein [Pseudomonadota bacterium]